jgi:VPDSG-CTERM motif
VTITLGPDTFINSQPIPFLFTFGGVTGNALFDLNADGVLAYNIVAVPNSPWIGKSDFTVYSALLTANPGPRAVPDGGTTVLLLGIGFLGIFVLQRKFAAALQT